MPLFKVQEFRSKKKCFVTGDTLAVVIQGAITKLNLRGDDYKVVDPTDGTEIDVDEVLLALAANGSADIMVMETSDFWESNCSGFGNMDSAKSTLVASPTPTVTSPASARPPSPSTASAAGARTTSAVRFCDIPFHKFPANVRTACVKKIRPLRPEMCQMRRVLADFIVHTLKDTSKATVENIAMQVVAEYPDSFEDRVSGVVAGTGYETMANRLYSAVLYEASKTKGPSAKKRRKSNKKGSATEASDEEAVDDVDELTEEAVEKVVLDEYGCKEWYSKHTESHEFQENKRMWLCTHYYGPNNMPDQVIDYMDKTYPSQRDDINGRKGNIDSVMKMWPYLQQPAYLLQHASRLVGRDLKPEFEKSMNELYKDLIRYLSIFAKKSGKSSEQEQQRVQKIRQLVEESKTSAKQLKSETPYILAVFPLLAAYFLESFDDFVVLEDVTITPMEIEEVLKFPHPYLVVAGRSLYAEPASVFVVAEGKVVMTTSNVLEGIQCGFLIYYVFGLKYPESCEATTFEFMQRYLFGINPKEGNKRTKNKRATIHPRVKTLSDKLEEYKMWTTLEI